ncbi:magnesium transporter [Desulfobulbus oligotrophicus]|jgi:magnesium transporter|uniref:Magnesium transporter MgtE n=1 Tax=Desulfobulbus oligotrophicus TaxID=1909699 RepID=A0A7T6AQ18_9BACT|nr:magnesium transporter [Desulfobulbus oligotrophicus]MDY0390265.1 magnesium transporter [Desulfobulbus oligotrophicus]QQG65088.1 magnesium transporter [Desulfobulbus oligotrophicus]
MTIENPQLISELREILATADSKQLQEFCVSAHPASVAELISTLSSQEAWEVLRHAPYPLRSEILSHLNEDLQIEIVGSLPRHEVAHLLADMSSDDRVSLFKKLSEHLQESILPALAQAEREDIRRLSAYREGTAGAVMTSDYATLSPQLTASQAIELLRKVAPDKETIYYTYVVDKDRKLLGLVSLRELIVAHRDARVNDIMNPEVIFARVDDDQEDVARKMQKYDLIALPVLNDDDVIVGIVTFDDVADIIVDEATEDFHGMAAISHKTHPVIGDINMRDASILLLVRTRLPWLLVLVFVNIFSSAGLAYFEDTIKAVVALVFFLPLLINSSGNAGSQAATLMVRALATGKARLSDWFFLLGKEVLVAGILGVILGAAVSFIGIFRAGPEVTLVISTTMVLTVLFGSLVGMSLPFLLSKLQLDPATASAPLITSIADIGGILIYLNIATYILKDMIQVNGGL